MYDITQWISEATSQTVGRNPSSTRVSNVHYPIAFEQIIFSVILMCSLGCTVRRVKVDCEAINVIKLNRS